MHPTRARKPLRTAAIGSFLAVIVVAGACGGPAAPPLTDPDEILTGAFTAAAAATSVHIDAAVDGAVAIDLMGSGGDGAPVKLTNTTASADVDLAERRRPR